MNDEKLIKRAIKGHRDAFISLMELYEKDLYNLAKSMLGNNDLINDVVQETIITAYEKISTLQKPSSFKSWLLKILVNKGRDYLSKQSKVIYLDEPIEINVIEKAYENIELMELLSHLSADFRTVITMFYFNGLSYKEIAEVLNISEGTVKSRLHRSKEELCKMLNIMEGKKYEGKCN